MNNRFTPLPSSNPNPVESHKFVIGGIDIYLEYTSNGDIELRIDKETLLPSDDCNKILSMIVERFSETYSSNAAFGSKEAGDEHKCYLSNDVTIQAGQSEPDKAILNFRDAFKMMEKLQSDLQTRFEFNERMEIIDLKRQMFSQTSGESDTDTWLQKVQGKTNEEARAYYEAAIHLLQQKHEMGLSESQKQDLLATFVYVQNKRHGRGGAGS